MELGASSEELVESEGSFSGEKDRFMDRNEFAEVLWDESSIL